MHWKMPDHFMLDHQLDALVFREALRETTGEGRIQLAGKIAVAAEVNNINPLANMAGIEWRDREPMLQIYADIPVEIGLIGSEIGCAWQSLREAIQIERKRVQDAFLQGLYAEALASLHTHYPVPKWHKA